MGPPTTPAARALYHINVQHNFWIFQNVFEDFGEDSRFANPLVTDLKQRTKP